MVGPSMLRRLLVSLLLISGATWGCLSSLPGQTLRLSRNVPGDFKTLLLHADEIATWTEGNRRVFLMRGLVLVEQGLATVRMEQGVGWIDQDDTRRTGLTRIDLYAEGDVRIENGSELKTGSKAIIDLTTRGEVKIKSQQGGIVKKDLSSDPLVQRARAELSAPERTAKKKKEPEIKDGAVKQASFQPDERSATSTPLPYTPLPAVPSETTRPLPLPAAPATPPAAGPETAPAPMQPLPFQDPRPIPRAGEILPPQGATPNSSSYQPPALAPYTPPPAVPSGPPSAVPIAPPPRTMPGQAPGTPPEEQGSQARQIRVVPRTQAPFQVQEIPLTSGEKAFVVTGGIIMTVIDPQNPNAVVDIEADRLVIWTKDDPSRVFRSMRTDQGSTTRDVEVFLSGNVMIREQSGRARQDRAPQEYNKPKDDTLENHTLKADEVYYDFGRNVAVAYQADLSFRQGNLPDPIHLKADELLQLSPTLYEGVGAEVYSSKLPSDPGLKIYVNRATLQERQIQKRSIFGRQVIDRETGEPKVATERYFDGDDVYIELADVPVFYLPFLRGDAENPLGPLNGFRFGYNRIYGGRFSVGFNLYDLLGIDPVPGTRWDLDLDYLTRRGPGLGTEFDYVGQEFLGLEGNNVGHIQAWGLHDASDDILGGDRGRFQPHPEWRGRFFWRHYQELNNDFTLQFQASALSDKNFLEQYFYNEFNRDVNQETFIYLKQQRDNWAWTVLAEPRIRTWVNETEKLPEARGYLIGQSFFDIFTYNAHGAAGYLNLKTSNVLPPPLETTTANVDAGRFDLWQDMSLPFYLGPVKLAPYGVVDLTYYTQDLTGNDQGRFYGGGGARGSMPFSRLFPEIESDLFNLNGIYHKVVFSGNYYVAHSDTPFSQLPQFDRLNDDATDQSIRDMNRPIAPGAIARQFAYNPANAVALTTSPLFDPQTYAIRRLVDNRIDTLDTIEVLQGGIRQRWQTKRGYPGIQHVVDWMTLDLSTSMFPHSGRDNFGEAFAFYEYDYLWNIGDRTAIVSDGWFDPFSNGARVWNVGAFLNRPDRTSFYLGYRQTDPLRSRLVSGSATYVFSPRYAITAGASYDLGLTEALNNSLVITRMGSDLMVSVGISYNALVNNFGFTFEIMPNVVGQQARRGGIGSGLFAQQNR